MFASDPRFFPESRVGVASMHGQRHSLAWKGHRKPSFEQFRRGATTQKPKHVAKMRLAAEIAKCVALRNYVAQGASAMHVHNQVSELAFTVSMLPYAIFCLTSQM